MRLEPMTAVASLAGIATGVTLGVLVAYFASGIEPPRLNRQFRTELQDQAESERNEGWNPNAALMHKSPMPPMPERSVAVVAGRQPQTEASDTGIDWDSIFGPKPAQRTPTPAAQKSAALDARRPPAGSLAVLEAGAFASAEDARAGQQRMLAIGLEGRLIRLPGSGGRYTVRLGPFSDPDEAGEAKAQLQALGVGARTQWIAP